MPLRALVVVIGGCVGVLLALIDPAGGDPVAEHLGDVFFRHLAPAHEDVPVRGDAVVDPVFKVMAVAALVVQPRQAQARGLPLGIVRAAVALIVVDTAPELGGAVFAQVVRQTLPDQAEPEAVFAHKPPVAVDRAQMCEELHADSPCCKLRLGIL